VSAKNRTHSLFYYYNSEINSENRPIFIINLKLNPKTPEKEAPEFRKNMWAHHSSREVFSFPFMVWDTHTYRAKPYLVLSLIAIQV